MKKNPLLIDTNINIKKELEKFEEPKGIKQNNWDCSYFTQCLAPEEVELLKEHNGGGSEPLIMFGLADLASIMAEELFPDINGDGHLVNEPGDAFRHAYWSALITSYYGEDFARKFTTAHEEEPSAVSDARQQSFMDLHNNNVGIQIAISNPNAQAIELALLVESALKEGQLYVWDGENIYTSNTCPSC